MAAQRTGILQNDCIKQIYQNYLLCWDSGVDTPAAIRTVLEAENAVLLEDSSTTPLFWLALARAQWECGVLEADILAKVSHLVQHGAGTALGIRQSTLTRLFKQIEVPPIAARPRPRERWIDRAPFRSGECLAVRLSDGDWGAALVIAARKTYNLIGTLRFKGPERPDLSVFTQREWLVLTHHNWYRQINLDWFNGQYLQGYEKTLERVGWVPITDADSQDCNSYSGWCVGIQVELQFAWEAANATQQTQ